MAAYLEFEDKIKKIEDDIIIAKTKSDEHAVEILEKKLEKEVEKTFKNLSDYQKLQLARHPDRPYSLDYINGLLTNAYEIHGDRHYVDDHAIVCYLGFIGEQKVLVIGEQKGRGTKDKLYRNFGMPSNFANYYYRKLSARKTWFSASNLRNGSYRWSYAWSTFGRLYY